MNDKQLEEIFSAQWDVCYKTMVAKGKKYSSETDRLVAFRTAAALQHETLEEALVGMFSKQIVSIVDMAKRADDPAVDIAAWDDPITDVINYMILLRAIVEERSRNQNYTDNAAFDTNNKRETSAC